MIRLFCLVTTLLLLLGCQSHYTLYIIASPIPLPQATGDPTDSGLTGTKDLDPPTVPALPPQAPSKFMTNTPGAFTATQSRGGSMVNVTINLNLEKPTAVSTQTPISVSGIPGM
jgi:hypothetical protein